MTEDRRPLVSVLIPTHERPHYFSLALASVVKQSYENIEIIVSDNSMDDKTEEIVRDFQKVFGNIKYFHTPGLDMWGNWQKCWDNMSPESEYVNFLMDDDIFAPTKIEKMMNYFIADPSLALVTSYRKLIDENGGLLPDRDFNSPILESDSYVEGETAGQQIVLSNINWIGEPTTVLFNRKYTNGYFKGWTGNEKYLILDYPLWLRLLQQGNMVYISEPLSFFRQHETNDSKDLTTLVKGSISLALMIQNAWNKRIYIKEIKELKLSILSWYDRILKIMQLCYECDYKGEEFDDLLKVFNAMSMAYADPDPGEIVFDLV